MVRMRYFGTDGIRGKADALLEEELPYWLGRALAFKESKVIVARDVRLSSLDIEKQLCKGLLDGRAQIWLTGVLPTPALAYIASKEKADYAVMITASHNPPEFNGLKVFGKCGKKLSFNEEKNLDGAIVALRVGTTEISDDGVAADGCYEEDSHLQYEIFANNHRVRIASGAEQLYAEHVSSMFPRFDGIKVCLDCAHGCYATLAPKIFESLGAKVRAIHNTRDGALVNVNCGSTHIKALIDEVKPGEIGFAFDGDGDRVIAAVDGKPYDGDAILLALSTLYRIQGKLRKKFVVGTILTNSRLQRELAFQNTALVRTDVGDKHVLEALINSNCPLGGEKSGHVIMTDRALTGDGVITALALLEVKKTIGSLPRFVPYPMLEFNIEAEHPEDYISSAEFEAKLKLVKLKYNKKGRLIVRPSGTEPFVRVAFECFSQEAEPVFADIKRMLSAQRLSE